MYNDDFTKLISKYLNANKSFTVNDVRMKEVKDAMKIANKLFNDMDVFIKRDSLQLGHAVLCIQGFDIVIRGSNEIELFKDLISKADNFEIYAGKESVKFSIMFGNVFNVTIK